MKRSIRYKKNDYEQVTNFFQIPQTESKSKKDADERRKISKKRQTTTTTNKKETPKFEPDTTPFEKNKTERRRRNRDDKGNRKLRRCGSSL